MHRKRNMLYLQVNEKGQLFSYSFVLERFVVCSTSFFVKNFVTTVFAFNYDPLQSCILPTFLILREISLTSTDIHHGLELHIQQNFIIHMINFLILKINLYIKLINNPNKQ